MFSPSPKSHDGRKSISSNSRNFFSLETKEFRVAFPFPASCSFVFARWIQPQLEHDDSILAAAIDGKTCCQGFDENGDPEILLNVFLHNLKLTITQWQVGKSKTNEPGCLKENLQELLRVYPLLNLLTGDAIFLQRSLLEILQDKGCDSLFQVKANQPGLCQASVWCCRTVARTRFRWALEACEWQGGQRKPGEADRPLGLATIVFATIWMTPSGCVIR